VACILSGIIGYLWRALEQFVREMDREDTWRHTGERMK
jgi:hypothetical protein